MQCPPARLPGEFQRVDAPPARLFGKGAMPGEILSPEIAPDTWIKVQDFAEIAAAGESAVVNFRWPMDCIVCRFAGTTVGAGSAAGLASIGVKISINGNEQALMLEEEEGPDYILLANILGHQGNPAPFFRQVRTGHIWTIQCKNFSAGTAFTPQLSWAIRRL